MCCGRGARAERVSWGLALMPTPVSRRPSQVLACVGVCACLYACVRAYVRVRVRACVSAHDCRGPAGRHDACHRMSPQLIGFESGPACCLNQTTHAPMRPLPAPTHPTPSCILPFDMHLMGWWARLCRGCVHVCARVHSTRMQEWEEWALTHTNTHTHTHTHTHVFRVQEWEGWAHSDSAQRRGWWPAVSRDITVVTDSHAHITHTPITHTHTSRTNANTIAT